MGRWRRVPPQILILLMALLQLAPTAAEGDGRCKGVVSCLKCDATNTTRCAKCTHLVLRSKHCTGGDEVCPSGYTRHWTSLVEYMATVCKESLGVGGMSGEAVGATVGIVVCLVIALATAIYCRLKRRRKPPPSLTHSSQGSGGGGEESDCIEFVKQINELRRDAPVFLAMLNDTRRQVRALRSHSALQPYKPVLKDLSRILILVNRPEERLGHPPPDWETLLAWGHRVLARYKKSHPNQVNELVSFLSGGSRVDGQYVGAGIVHSGGRGLSVFDTNYNNRKTSSRDYSSDWHTISEFDDFFTLGFRPQDEITTEL